MLLIQVVFYSLKWIYFSVKYCIDLDLNAIMPQVYIELDNGLSPVLRQAITWTKLTYLCYLCQLAP